MATKIHRVCFRRRLVGTLHSSSNYHNVIEHRLERARTAPFRSIRTSSPNNSWLDKIKGYIPGLGKPEAQSAAPYAAPSFSLENYADELQKARKMGTPDQFVRGCSGQVTMSEAIEKQEAIIRVLACHDLTGEHLEAKHKADAAKHCNCTMVDVENALSKFTWAKAAQKKIAKLKEEGKPMPKSLAEVLGYNGKFWLEKNAFHDFGFQVHRDRSITNTNEEKVDPFTLVADELAVMANRLRLMVVTEIPKLATAAEYFFKMGVEGKRFRPMVLLLMASSLTMAVPEMAVNSVNESFAKELRFRQQRIAEITEMIHVASLLHDDVLDDAETRRGISSLNFMMGNKLAVLAGDFLLSRASVALASLKDTEVVELLSKVLEHLVTGEIMQMTTSSEQCCSMEYYMQKTFCKTASLMANSCKAIALLAGQPREVAMLAYDYGRNLGLAYQLVDDILDYTGTTASLGKGPLSDIRQGIVTAPMLYALEEFPELHSVISRRFKNPGDVDYALEFLGKSQGIRKTKQLAAEHVDRAASAVDSFPASDIENVKVCRKALIDLTEKVITRTK